MDAGRRSVSLNSLVKEILTRYTEWDRYAQKFGVISISGEVFRAVLEAVDPEKLQVIARDMGSRIPKEASLLVFQKTSVDTYFAGLTTLLKYGEFGEYDVKRTREGYTVLLRHGLGIKWSEFLKSSLTESAKILLGTVPCFEMTPNSFVTIFRLSGHTRSLST
jgi:hypothetical protein